MWTFGMEYLTVLSYGTLLLDADMILAPSTVELVLATSCQILEESDAWLKTGSNNAHPIWSLDDIMQTKYNQSKEKKGLFATLARHGFATM